MQFRVFEFLKLRKMWSFYYNCLFYFCIYLLKRIKVNTCLRNYYLTFEQVNKKRVCYIAVQCIAIVCNRHAEWLEAERCGNYFIQNPIYKTAHNYSKPWLTNCNINCTETNRVVWIVVNFIQCDRRIIMM